MIRLVRIVGILLAAAGAVICLAWAIEPLREIWPWLRSLPWPLQLGFGLAATGLLLLLGSLIWERLEDRKQDKDLLD
jgi:hypothetical protein